MRFEAPAIHIGEKPERGYDYSRTANPTREVLEDIIAQFEGGKAVTTLWLMCCPKGLIR